MAEKLLFREAKGHLMKKVAHYFYKYIYLYIIYHSIYIYMYKYTYIPYIYSL